MFKDTPAFSGFSTNNIESAKQFYADKLGLNVEQTPMGLNISLHGGGRVFIYEKPNHEPASFTILNFVVDNIDAAVEKLAKLGVTFEHYEGINADSDIARGLKVNRGPDIAWFKDPAGNILAVLQDA